MTQPRQRLGMLVAAILLFVGWIAWLAYLAATTTQQMTLSRPQFLMSEVDIVAEVSAGDSRPDAEVKIVEVIWPESAELKAGQSIRVANLPLTTRRGDGWIGAGRYLLPLRKLTDQTYRVAPIPPSPGFPGVDSPPRIYPDTPRIREQLLSIRGK